MGNDLTNRVARRGRNGIFECYLRIGKAHCGDNLCGKTLISYPWVPDCRPVKKTWKDAKGSGKLKGSGSEQVCKVTEFTMVELTRRSTT